MSIITPNNDNVKVVSELELIDSVIVYDLLGRVLIDQKDINALEFTVNESQHSAGTYIVKVTLLNGKQKIQKVILK